MRATKFDRAGDRVAALEGPIPIGLESAVARVRRKGGVAEAVRGPNDADADGALQEQYGDAQAQCAQSAARRGGEFACGGLTTGLPRSQSREQQKSRQQQQRGMFRKQRARENQAGDERSDDRRAKEHPPRRSEGEQREEGDAHIRLRDRAVGEHRRRGDEHRQADQTAPATPEAARRKVDRRAERRGYDEQRGARSCEDSVGIVPFVTEDLAEANRIGA